MFVACFVASQFGVACERARLPGVWGEPVVLVGGDGVVRAVSDEASASGIRVGQSVVSARVLCARLLVLPYDRDAYETAAHALWDLFAIESSVVEPVSPEVCFVELSGRNPLARARELAHALMARVRIPIRVGLARTKMVARLAALHTIGIDEKLSNNLSCTEDDLVRYVAPGWEADFLASVALDEIEERLLPASLRTRLQRLGVQTLRDIRQLPRQELQRHFSQQSHLLQKLAIGEDGERVRPVWPPRQLERSLSFEGEVCQLQTLHHALLRCAQRLARALTEEKGYCRGCLLELQWADGTRTQEGERLLQPLNGTEEIHRVALRLLSRLTLSQPLSGVTLIARELGAGSALQLDLDMDRDTNRSSARREQLNAALTYLRRRYGVGAVVTAALLHQSRRLNLWTYRLTRLASANESVAWIEVTTDARGLPVRFLHRGETFEVKSVQNRWREVDWAWDTATVKTAYRLETHPPGLYELHRVGGRWRMGGVAD